MPDGLMFGSPRCDQVAALNGEAEGPWLEAPRAGSNALEVVGPTSFTVGEGETTVWIDSDGRNSMAWWASSFSPLVVCRSSYAKWGSVPVSYQLFQ